MMRVVFAIVLSSSAMAGCASARRPLLDATSSCVWPMEPEQPRVRFLGQVQWADEVERRGEFARALRQVAYGPEKRLRLITPHSVSVHDNGRKVAVADTSIADVLVFDLHLERVDALYFQTNEGEETGAVGVAWAGDQLGIADAKLHCVGVVRPDGGSIRFGSDRLRRPSGIAFHPVTRRFYVADAAAHTIVVFDLDGGFVSSFGSRGSGPGQLNFPSQVSCAPNGDVLVADTLNFRIQRFTADGTWVGGFGTKGDAAGDFALPKGVAVDPSGAIWVLDAHFENLQAFTSDGQLLFALGGQGHGPGQFWLPGGLAIGSDRRLWVADTYNRRVQVFELLP